MLDIIVKPFSVTKAVGRKPNGALRIGSLKHLEALPMKVILELHNSFTEGLAVTNFDDRQTAIDRTWPLVKQHVLSLSDQPPEDSMAKTQEEKDAAKAAKAEAAATAKAAKEAAATAKKDRKPGEETPVVALVIKLLRRKEGATKKELMEATAANGTKEGYINALLSRILKEKGYVLTSEAVENERAKRYHVSAEPPVKPAATEAAASE